MLCDTIKFKVKRNPETNNLHLQVYRPYGIEDEMMIVDEFNEMTEVELKCLTEYLLSLFKKKKS
jgi:hypothetical protein